MQSPVNDHEYCLNAAGQPEFLTATPLDKIDGTAMYSPQKSTNSKTPVSKRICCVPECHTMGYTEIPGHGKPSYHKLPNEGDPLRSVWLNKIKRDEGPHFKVTKATVVCSLHFEKDCVEKSLFANRTYLKPGAVPTIFECWNDKVPFYKPRTIRKRNALQQKRDETNIENRPVEDTNTVEQVNDPQSPELKVSTAETQVENEFINKRVHGVLVNHVNFLQDKSQSLAQENEKLKSELEKLKAEKELNSFSIDNMKPSEVQFYTGFSSREVFDAVLELVNPGEKGENIVMNAQKDIPTEENVVKRSKKLSPENQFLLFLCRVRVGLFEFDLAKRFNVSIGTVSMLIISWANFLFLRLGSMNIWPSREQVDSTMPVSFKEKYPTTRVIIDCTELKTEMSSSLLLKSQTYSNYKSSNTLKGLVGIAPCGSITFVSQLYLGNISDREITERSGFLGMDFNNGDSVMADKGFDIQDLLDSMGVKLNIPPFLGQYDQMTDSDVRQTQSIAAERIHVERAINKIKNFHIFDQAIPMSLFGSINQIWTVCALLTLFQDPIISCPGN